MVETRSGLSIEPPEASHVHEDTAATAAPATPPRLRRQRASSQPSDRPDGLNDSQAYTLLALSLGLLALPLMLVPSLAARAAFGTAATPVDSQHVHTLGLLACGLMAAAACAFALEECARKHMLRTFTGDTLKLALAAFAAGNLLLVLYYPATLSPYALILSVLSQAGTLALPASQLFVLREDRGRVLRDFRCLPYDLPRGFWLRKSSLPAMLYLSLCVAFPIAGLTYLASPSSSLYHALGYVYGKSTFMVWRAVGLGLLTIMPAMAYTLKDKAENDLLARSVPRTLNLGLLAASIGHLLVLGPILNQGHGGSLLPPIVATWAVGLLAAMAGLAAPDAAALAEQLTGTAATD